MGANIGNLGGLNGYQHGAYAQATKTGGNGNSGKSGVNLKPIEQLLETPIDNYTPSVEGAANPATIERLWKETNHAAEAIRKLVQSIISNNDATGQGFWARRAGGGFKISDADRVQAQQMIGEDGFFGVKQTTARIMDFAKALVGEGASEEKIEKMRDAVQKAFDEVAGMFGGFDKLPGVTKDTYSAIMEAFDAWVGSTQESAA